MTLEGATARWRSFFFGWPCCCRDAPWPILARTDAPCCGLSHQKIKSRVWVNAGIFLEQIPVVGKCNTGCLKVGTGIFCEGWAVMFIVGACRLRNAPWPMQVGTDAPCCALSQRKIKFWVRVHAGMMTEQ